MTKNNNGPLQGDRPPVWLVCALPVLAIAIAIFCYGTLAVLARILPNF